MNVRIETLSTTARDGMRIIIILAIWMGHVVEVDVYRASDMHQLETTTLKAKAA